MPWNQQITSRYVFITLLKIYIILTYEYCLDIRTSVPESGVYWL